MAVYMLYVETIWRTSLSVDSVLRGTKNMSFIRTLRFTAWDKFPCNVCQTVEEVHSRISHIKPNISLLTKALIILQTKNQDWKKNVRYIYTWCCKVSLQSINYLYTLNKSDAQSYTNQKTMFSDDAAYRTEHKTYLILVSHGPLSQNWQLTSCFLLHLFHSTTLGSQQFSRKVDL